MGCGELRQRAEHGQRALGLLGVDLPDGVADVHDHVVADHCVRHQCDRDFLADAAELDQRQRARAQFDQSGGNG